MRIDGAVLSEEAFLVRLFGEHAERLLVFNFGRDLTPRIIPEPLLAPPADGAWRLLWSSEHPTYGGDGVREPEKRSRRRVRDQVAHRSSAVMSAGTPSSSRRPSVLGEVDCHRDPLPALGRDGLGLGLELLGDEPVEQRNVLKPAAIVVLEEIAHHGAAGLLIHVDPDELRAAVGGTPVFSVSIRRIWYGSSS